MQAKIRERIQIGSRKIKNSVAMAPMCGRLANPDGSVNPQLIAYYESRAAGATGLIFIEYTYIVGATGKAGKDRC